MTPTERLAARQTNEIIKAMVGLLNNLATALLVGAFIQPFITRTTPDLVWACLLIILGIMLHLLARFQLYELKLEE